MNVAQFVVVVGLILVGIAVIPWSVERAVNKRWNEIREMFDRALMHGGSLDTLGKALKATSEESRAKADQALTAVEKQTHAMALLHQRVKTLEEHPVLRKLGGNGGGG
jgi:hypothetical protein